MSSYEIDSLSKLDSADRREGEPPFFYRAELDDGQDNLLLAIGRIGVLLVLTELAIPVNPHPNLG